MGGRHRHDGRGDPGARRCPARFVAVILAATMFGAAYITLTGLVLLWSTRLYPDRTSFGVGIAFFTIAAGQALGDACGGRAHRCGGTENVVRGDRSGRIVCRCVTSAD